MFLRPRLNLGRPKKSSGILPTDLDNLDYWHDANDASTFSLSGSEVITWFDKNPTSNIDVTSSAGTRPSRVSDGSDFAVDYNGVNHHLDITGISISMVNATFFAVIKSDNIALSSDLFFTMRGVGEIFDLRINSNNYRVINRSSAGSSLDALISGDNNRTALIVNYSSSGTGDITDDEGVTANDSDVGTIITPATSLIYGAGSTSGGSAWAGLTYEMGMYSVEHSAADRTALMNYLRAKWI